MNKGKIKYSQKYDNSRKYLSNNKMIQKLI